MLCSEKLKHFQQKHLLFSFLLFSLSLSFSNAVYGKCSAIDSLEQQLSITTDVIQKVDLLNKLGYKYYRKDIKNTYRFGQEALELANSINYTRGASEAYFVLSIGNSVEGKYKQSDLQLDQSIKLSKQIKAYDLTIRAYNGKAINLEKQGRLDEAIIVYQEALDLANQHKDAWGIRVIPVNLGGIHHSNQDYELARVYFRQSMKEAELQKDNGLWGWGARKVAETYLEEDNLLEAKDYFDKALTVAIEVQEDRSIAFCQSRLAEIFLKTNQQELAEQTVIQSITLFKKVGDKEGLIQAIPTLMKVFLETDRSQKAIRLVRDLEEFNQPSLNIHTHLEILKLLSRAYVQQKNYESAYALEVSLQTYKDSLNLEKKLNLASELEEKYQSKKKEAENALLKVEQQKQAVTIQQQKLFNYTLSAVAILLALLGFSACKAYVNKRKNNLLLEKKVTERTQALVQANQQLMQSNKELERFAYVASHDLREPLRNIINFTNLLQKEVDINGKAESKQYMDIIHQNTSQMNGLILDTLEFTKLSNNKVKIEAVDLNEVIKDIQSAIATTLNSRKAVIKVAQRLPVIQSNTGMMFSLFKNLIENGIKYNKSDIPTIVIDYQMDLDNHTFSIKDNGIGIPAKYQEVIFEMFRRLQNKNEYEGSGLGLSNCKKIVKKMGGKLWVKSEEGQGATFYFTMKKQVDKSNKKPIKKQLVGSLN